MTYLFLDDERVPEDVTWVLLPPGQPIIVRTQEEFQRYLLANGIPHHISFDNDLGDGFGEGIECAKWMTERIMDGDLALPDDFDFTVHSKNPVAADRIMSLLDNFIRFWQGEQKN